MTAGRSKSGRFTIHTRIRHSEACGCRALETGIKAVCLAILEVQSVGRDRKGMRFVLSLALYPAGIFHNDREAIAAGQPFEIGRLERKGRRVCRIVIGGDNSIAEQQLLDRKAAEIGRENQILLRTELEVAVVVLREARGLGKARLYGKLHLAARIQCNFEHRVARDVFLQILALEAQR